MKKKNLVLYFPSKDPVNSAFDLLSSKMELYENQMLEEIPQDMVNIYMVRHRDYFFWKNEFLPQFQLIANTWSPYSKKDHVFWDLVYGFKMWEWVTHTRNSNIKNITKNKLVIEDIFPHLCNKSLICNSYEDIINNFSKVKTDLKVLKPCHGCRSKGIFIQKHLPQKNEIENKHYPYLLQEFFDTSNWFFWVSWLHDFRVVIQWWEIIWAYLRQPAPWKYTANSFARWNFIDYTHEGIPEEILKIVDEVDDYCKEIDTHRFYSIDMWVWKDGNIKIFEMNSAPEFSAEYQAREFWRYTAKNILKVI